MPQTVHSNFWYVESYVCVCVCVFLLSQVALSFLCNFICCQAYMIAFFAAAPRVWSQIQECFLNLSRLHNVILCWWCAWWIQWSGDFVVGHAKAQYSMNREIEALNDSTSTFVNEWGYIYNWVYGPQIIRFSPFLKFDYLMEILGARRILAKGISQRKKSLSCQKQLSSLSFITSSLFKQWRDGSWSCSMVSIRSSRNLG